MVIVLNHSGGQKLRVGGEFRISNLVFFPGRSAPDRSSRHAPPRLDILRRGDENRAAGLTPYSRRRKHLVPRSPTESPQYRLDADIQFVPGVGPQRAELLRRLGIERAVDLVFFFPRDYETPATVQSTDGLEPGQQISVSGTIVEMEQRVTASGKHMLGALLQLASGTVVRLVWFNQPFRTQELRRGLRVCATGTVRSTHFNWEISQPRLVVLGEDEEEVETRPLPVYRLTEGLKGAHLRRLLRRTLPVLIPQVPEVLPDWLRERLAVVGIHAALEKIHFPESTEDIHLAQRRFKLQELLSLQLALLLQRHRRVHEKSAPHCPPEGKIHHRILRRLGVELTDDQLAAIADIGRDMASGVPMNRLLQGDVGSGKTVVAIYALLLCVAHGCQAALMVPTEVLAQQHYRTLTERLHASRVRTALITGSLAEAQRRELLVEIREGRIDLVIGTQALLSDEVQFARLGLVIVDEQHKFGVRQRARLRTGEQHPHYLVLTATPIPRTIGLAMYGDLDVSVIRQSPPGRAPVHTYCIASEKLGSWWDFVRKQLAQGRQAYVIAPRVEADEETGAASVIAWHQRLSQSVLPEYSLGLLHGRMSSAEKETTLEGFANGTIQVLVATTVVEVGIDVPNATVMTILDADRLGLAQLHQLRGRVARGKHAGFVCAVASPGCEPTEHRRLEAFAQSCDGFELAELDLKLRGPGDILGTAQSGLPPLRMANLVEDEPLLQLARQVAEELLSPDPDLSRADLLPLRRRIVRQYGQRLNLSDVG
ncbi:MAG: ATP-dependent DNA helicase RecG [Pirellulaceae bacterium]|nr:MAG: ATP-dependent DNA helicase RecG [Pirellulaceae bacterium]